MFCEKSVLRNFSEFTGKHLCQSLFFKEVAFLSPATFFEKDTGTGVFGFCEISKDTFSTEQLGTTASVSWR